MSDRVRLGSSAVSPDDIGGTSCQSSDWASDSAIKCKSSTGQGGGSRRGRGVHFVVTAGSQQGSLTDAWCYDVPVASSAGGATNGPSSGSTSVTLTGSGFGRQSFSARGRIGRGAAFQDDMTGGTACEVSNWASDSALRCKLSSGVGGGWPVRRGRGMPVVVNAGLQQGRLTDAGGCNTPVGAWTGEGSGRGKGRDRGGPGNF